jgi:hypothetical protein
MIDYLLIIMLVAGVLVLVLACILVFPRWFVKHARLTPEPEKVSTDPLKSEELRLKAEADRLKAENDVRTTLLQGIGGLAILAGVALTWVQFQATLKATQNQQEVARQQLANAEKQFKETQERNRRELEQNRAQFEAAQAKNREDLSLNRKQFEATVNRTRGEMFRCQSFCERLVGFTQ